MTKRKFIENVFRKYVRSVEMNLLAIQN